MSIRVDLQIASEDDDLPGPGDMERWARAALDAAPAGSEVTLRIVDTAEAEHLNHTYRNKTGPTNVLSFPFEAPPGANVPLLGDIVVCAPVVRREAAEQGKTVHAHWAHMIVHGALHLLGYDHGDDAEASTMESKERVLLSELGFADPYEPRGEA